MHAEDDGPHEQEEVNRSENRLRSGVVMVVEGTDEELQQGLCDAGDVPERAKLHGEEKIAELDKGEEVDEEGNDKSFHVLDGILNGLRQHRQSSVELKHVDELDGGQENHDCQHDAVSLRPQTDRHEVHIVTFAV